MSRRIFCRVLLVAITIFSVLVLPSILAAQGHSEEAFERVKQVQERHTDRLLAIEGVEGTAIGLDDNDQPAVKVFLDKPGVAGIPKKLDEVPVQVEVTGKFYALPNAKPDRVSSRYWFPRPVPIGVSTGNEGECSAGTIACRVKDATGSLYALSNNHVYALENKAQTGSKVLQPGLYDTGCAYSSANVIGTLYYSVRINFEGGDNVVDAAIAALTSADMLGKATPSGGYGTPKSATVPAAVGQAVQKYGRTTSLTKGTITGINATVNVTYSSGTARFVNQVLVQSRRAFIKAGDSGSLLVTDPDRNPVGLLFAGNSSGTFAVANPIGSVLSSLGVTIDGL